jgi:hypothetical protein
VMRCGGLGLRAWAFDHVGCTPRGTNSDIVWTFVYPRHAVLKFYPSSHHLDFVCTVPRRLAAVSAWRKSTGNLEIQDFPDTVPKSKFVLALLSTILRDP